MDGAHVMGVQLADGRLLRYPSLDGDGIAHDPHQERPDITWTALADQFGQPMAQLLQLQAEAAEARHVEEGCPLTEAVAQRLDDALRPPG